MNVYLFILCVIVIFSCLKYERVVYIKYYPKLLNICVCYIGESMWMTLNEKKNYLWIECWRQNMIGEKNG